VSDTCAVLDDKISKLSKIRESQIKQVDASHFSNNRSLKNLE
jgi:hypothetical protein